MMTLNSIIIVIFIALFAIFSQQDEVKPADQQSKDVEKTFTKIGLEGGYFNYKYLLLRV